MTSGKDNQRKYQENTRQDWPYPRWFG